MQIFSVQNVVEKSTQPHLQEQTIFLIVIVAQI